MRWDVLPGADPRRLALARALVRVTARRGWGRGAMAEASLRALGDAAAWRAVFPGGAREAIGFISLVSDASMAAAFRARPAAAMAEVIGERLRQNRRLKPFVRRVMLFDFAHPVQALARMQRTARAMAACLGGGGRSAGPVRLALLNLFYTAVVFRWLFDRSKGDRASLVWTARLMRVLGM